MAQILKDVLDCLPNKSIANSCFEGANIVLYTKDKEFLLDSNELIKDIVNKLKKRVELRADPSIVMDMEEAEAKIRALVPEDAKLAEVIFDPQRSRLIIEAEKPGVVIGKQGEILKTIKKQTLWSPQVRRVPAIRSKIIENIRQVLYENNDYRKKFLNSVGERIYSTYTKERKNVWVRVSFLGGARQVGRSCFLLQTPESKLLLDCGVNVAASEDSSYPILDAPEFNLSSVDAVILSHAHLDHSGFIPWLYKMGYKGPVYCTPPTRDVSALLALDYISVAFKEAKKSLFSSTDVKEMVKHTICLEYEEVTDITPDVRLTLYNAGHALGSAMAHLHIGNGMHNLLYTGDFKFAQTKTLEAAPIQFPRLETVMMESTYGGKNDIPHTLKEAEESFIKAIKDTLAQGGKVLIPVLGVGRSQEMMLILERIMREGIIEKVPVFVQGLVWDVTAIHTAYPDYLNAKIKKMIFHQDNNPFLSDIFQRVSSYKEQLSVIEEKGPCIILATSGMLTGGPSVEYFKQLAPNSKNSIIFVNYQGEGSLGRIIQRGDKELNYNFGSGNENIKINMTVYTIEGFSGHSNRKELMNFVSSLEPLPKKVIVVHGESSKCLDLASSLHKTYNIETSAPKNLDVIRIR